MDIKSLASDIVEVEFSRGGSEVAHFRIDRDAMTENYYRGVGERQAARLRAKGAGVEEIEKAAEIPAEDQEEDKPFTAEDSAVWVEKFFSRAADNMSEQRFLKADMLSHGVLVDWDTTSEGQPLPCTEENLLKYFSLRALEEMWAFCLEQTQTVRTRKQIDEETPKTGGSFSRA